MTPSWQMCQCNPICSFCHHTKSPPTVLAIIIGAILIAPKLVNNFPTSFTVAPLSNMSSTSKMLLPLMSFGVANVKASLTLSVLRIPFSNTFCSMVCLLFCQIMRNWEFQNLCNFNSEVLYQVS